MVSSLQQMAEIRLGEIRRPADRFKHLDIPIIMRSIGSRQRTLVSHGHWSAAFIN
jgi:hypothetical protein